MKRILILLFIVSTFTAYCQWIPCGPKGLIPNVFSNMFVLNDTIYGVNSGLIIYSTTPKDTCWKLTNDSLFNLFRPFAINGDQLYSRYSNKVMMTSDMGKTWIDPFPEFQAERWINALFFTGNIILANTSNYGLFLSEDSGKSWKNILNDQFAMYSHSIAASNNADTILLNTATLAYSSIDKGKTWKKSQLDESTTTTENKFSLLYKNNLLVWSTEKRLMRSTDGGESWKPENSISQLKKMYLIDTFLVALTLDDGARFYSKQNDKYVLVRSSLKGLVVEDICQIGNSLTANTSGGCLCSSDLGETWGAKNAGIFPGMRNMILIDTTIYASTSSLTAEPFKTTNNGLTWEKLHLDAFAPAFSLFSDITLLDSLFIYSQYFHNFLFVSTNGGKSWRNNYQDQSLQSLKSYSVFLNRDGSVLARAKDGIYISYDTIRTWTRIDSTQQAYSFKTIVKSGEKLFACSNVGILQSIDDGRHWSIVNYEFVNPKIRGIETYGKYVLAFSYDSLIYVSKDNGENWRALKTPFGAIESVAGAGDNFFAVSYGKGLYLTKDFGDSWELISGDLSRLYINKVLINSDSVFVPTLWTTIYKAALSDFGVFVSVNEEYGSEEKNFLSIYYPYPTPSRHELRATIQWDISIDINNDDISIYNLYGKVAGREDITIEKTLPFSGTLIWNCSRYEPGVYFIVVKHGDATRMLKAIVAR